MKALGLMYEKNEKVTVINSHLVKFCLLDIHLCLLYD